jgi:hypothetical protein
MINLLIMKFNKGFGLMVNGFYYFNFVIVEVWIQKKYDKKDSLYIYIHTHTNIYIHLNINDIFKAWWKKDLILGWWNLFQECPKSQKKKLLMKKIL